MQCSQLRIVRCLQKSTSSETVMFVVRHVQLRTQYFCKMYPITTNGKNAIPPYEAQVYDHISKHFRVFPHRYSRHFVRMHRYATFPSLNDALHAFAASPRPVCQNIQRTFQDQELDSASPVGVLFLDYHHMTSNYVEFAKRQGTLTLHRFIVSPRVKPSLKWDVILYVIKIIQFMNNTMRILHCDLHWQNILLRVNKEHLVYPLFFDWDKSLFIPLRDDRVHPNLYSTRGAYWTRDMLSFLRVKHHKNIYPSRSVWFKNWTLFDTNMDLFTVFRLLSLYRHHFNIPSTKAIWDIYFSDHATLSCAYPIFWYDLKTSNQDIIYDEKSAQPNYLRWVEFATILTRIRSKNSNPQIVPNLQSMQEWYITQKLSAQTKINHNT